MGCVGADPFKVLLEPTVGYDFAVTLAFEDGTTPINLTGRTYTAQVRSAPGAPLVVAFTVTVNAAAGEVVLSLDEAATALLDGQPSTLHWSLREDAAGVTTAICGGLVVPRKVVTS